MRTNWKELAEGAGLRSEIYGLLSTVFREELNEALIRKLRSPRMSSIFIDADVELGPEFYSESAATLKEALAVEFTRLFVGPGPHISAHESIFCEADGGYGGLWGGKTVEVKAFIQATGLDYDAGFNGIPDHISVELEFMQKLTEWEAVKWFEKDKTTAEYALSVQFMFLEQHLLCWLPRLCNEVFNRAKLPFYREMAALTKDYMEFEQHRLNTANAA